MYNPLDDLLQYYNYIFIAYIILAIIIFLNSFKAILNYYTREKITNKVGVVDIIISVMAGIALMGGSIFQGVISDISSEHFDLYADKMLLVSIISFVLFIVQLIYFIKEKES